MQFNSSGVVQNMEIEHVAGIHSLIEWLNQTVPKKLAASIVSGLNCLNVFLRVSL